MLFSSAGKCSHSWSISEYIHVQFVYSRPAVSQQWSKPDECTQDIRWADFYIQGECWTTFWLALWKVSLFVGTLLLLVHETHVSATWQLLWWGWGHCGVLKIRICSYETHISLSGGFEHLTWSRRLCRLSTDFLFPSLSLVWTKKKVQMCAENSQSGIGFISREGII